MAPALEGGEWSAARPGRTLPPGKTRYPFHITYISNKDKSHNRSRFVTAGTEMQQCKRENSQRISIIQMNNRVPVIYTTQQHYGAEVLVFFPTGGKIIWKNVTKYDNVLLLATARGRRNTSSQNIYYLPHQIQISKYYNWMLQVSEFATVYHSV